MLTFLSTKAVALSAVTVALRDAPQRVQCPSTSNSWPNEGTSGSSMLLVSLQTEHS